MGNRIQYTNDFSKIVEISFYHEYFLNTSLDSIDLVPDSETADLINNYNLIFRKKGNSFFIFKNNNSNVNSQVFSGTVFLKFTLKFNDLLFLNFTDMPFKYNQKFILKTSESDKSRLHPLTYTDESILEPYSENGVVGEVMVEINQNDEFFGNEEESTKGEPQKFYARFNARTVKFRYNFYFSGKENDFTNYFVFDENSNNRYTEFFVRKLENGMTVQSFVLPEQVKMSENYSHKLYLKQEDEFSKSFNKFLPHPTPNNLKYDIEENTFFLESFTKVN
jgi:hypothetical protein